MFFRKKKVSENTQETAQEENKTGLFSRLQSGLSKTAGKLGSGLNTILMGQRIVDEELLEEIEMQLLTADIGVEATDEIVNHLRDKVARNELQTVKNLNEIIKEKLTENR